MVLHYFLLFTENLFLTYVFYSQVPPMFAVYEYVCRRATLGNDQWRRHFFKLKKHMEFTKKDEERIVRLTGLKSCCSYFQNQKHGNKLFEPEFEFSKKINDILDSSLQVTPIELTEIINIINSLNQKEYYKGSGWFDYLLQVKDYLEFYGFNIEIKDGNMSELRVKN